MSLGPLARRTLLLTGLALVIALARPPDALGGSRAVLYVDSPALTAGAVQQSDSPPTEQRRRGVTLTVTSTADDIALDGQVTLREALTAANTNAAVGDAAAGSAGSLDVIEFAIPGSGPHVIRLGSSLPAITDAVTIDGLSEPDASCDVWPAMLAVVLDGSGIQDGSSGLLVQADDVTIQGLSIGNAPERRTPLMGGGFTREGGHGIAIEAVSRTTLACNYVGVAPDGTTATPNEGDAVVANGATDLRIGTADPEGRNLISGNVGRGIQLNGVDRASILNNYVGSTADGSDGLGNALGIDLDEGTTNVLVGAPGAGNLVSGNNGDGIDLLNGVTDVTIQANIVGPDITGTYALPDPDGGLQSDGIEVDGRSEANTVRIRIGGSGEGEGNLISGNNGDGIDIDDDTAQITIQGNVIGLTASGDAALPNRGAGIEIEADDSLIGGPEPAARNIVGANYDEGIYLEGRSSDPVERVIVQNNYVGVGADGVTPFGNGFDPDQPEFPRDGIELEVTVDALVTGNVIAANARHGVFVSKQVRDGVSVNNVISNNVIGTDASGTLDLGNGDSGVRTRSGGSLSVRENVIAFNGSAGVSVVRTLSTPSFAVQGQEVQRNAIYANRGLGIDLVPESEENDMDVVTVNDAGDEDDGPNKLQNRPTLSVATINVSAAGITYSVDSAQAASTAGASAYPITVDFYLADTAPDAPEGRTYLGSDTYDATDHGGGSVPSEVTATLTIPDGVTVSGSDRVVATATDADGNTSEFSAPETFRSTVSSGEAPGAVSLSAWPNPTAGILSVSLEGSSAMVRLAVYDALGREVAVLHDGPTAGAIEAVLPAGQLAPGAYVVRASGPGVAETVPLTVVR